MNEETPKRMKPVIILPVGEMSKDDIAKLYENGFCIVEAKNPDLVRFMEPPPLGYSVQEKAAIKLCRWILNQSSMSTHSKGTLSERLVNFLVEGSPLETPPYVPPPKAAKA